PRPIVQSRAGGAGKDTIRAPQGADLPRGQRPYALEVPARADRRRYGARPPFVVPRLGGGADQFPARGRRASAGAPCRRRRGARLSPRRPVGQASATGGSLGALLRERSGGGEIEGCPDRWRGPSWLGGDHRAGRSESG